MRGNFCVSLRLSQTVSADAQGDMWLGGKQLIHQLLLSTQVLLLQLPLPSTTQVEVVTIVITIRAAAHVPSPPYVQKPPVMLSPSGVTACTGSVQLNIPACLPVGLQTTLLCMLYMHNVPLSDVCKLPYRGWIQSYREKSYSVKSKQHVCIHWLSLSVG